MTTLTADAVVVGGGHHGLVAAAVLADAGWDVCLLEASDGVGGAVRSAELHPGFTTDLYSAFHPLAVASPILRSLELDRPGLRWSHAPAVLAHPRPPGVRRAAIFCTDGGITVAAIRSLLDQGDPRASVFADPDWDLREMATGHWAMVSAPEQAAQTLHEIAT